MYNQMKSRASEVTMRCTHLVAPAPDMLHCTIYFAPHICALHCSTDRGHFLWNIQMYIVQMADEISEVTTRCPHLVSPAPPNSFSSTTLIADVTVYNVTEYVAIVDKCPDGNFYI